MKSKSSSSKPFRFDDKHRISAKDFSVSLADYQIDSKQDWHSHEEFVLAMILRGNVREQVKSQDTLIDVFDVGVKAPDVLHTDHFCPKGVRVIRLSLSPKFVDELKSRSLINEGWYWLKNSDAVLPFIKIGHSLLNEKDEIENDVHELLASLLPKEKMAKSNPPFWLSRAKQQLDESFSDGIRLKQLAKEADVHPVYFARKFQQFFSLSVGSYVRKLQFRKVQSLLTTGKYSLSQIALEAGFTDQSHLTRTFVNDFKITPANLRRMLK